MRKIGLTILMAAVLTLAVASTALAAGGGGGGGGGYTPPNLGAYIVVPVAEGGMKCMLKQDYSEFCIMPPGYNMRAQVFKRGSNGTGYALVTSGVTVSYAIEGNTTSSNKTNFWTHAPSFGWNLANDVGTKGYGMTGTMAYNATTLSFEALKVPQTPFLDATPTTRSPYQNGIVTVKDATTGATLATQKFIMPASDEQMCKDCHGGTGGADTDRAILQSHDALSGTTLATDGRPNLCADCHADPSIGKAGNGVQKPLSTSMHSYHATKIPNKAKYSPVCYYCHPGPSTKCNRGAMANSKGCDNSNCHGGLSTMGSTSRTPWSAASLPKCGNCHQAMYAENAGKKFMDSVLTNGPSAPMNNKMLCQTCHGAQHAEWPASTTANDNQVPIALQNTTNKLGDDWCGSCHAVGGSIPFSGTIHR